jgi:hypothetical protein
MLARDAHPLNVRARGLRGLPVGHRNVLLSDHAGRDRLRVICMRALAQPARHRQDAAAVSVARSRCDGAGAAL